MSAQPGQCSPSIIIVGAGMSGLLMGIRLLQAGIQSFRIFEKADRVGGTWRDNSYPGLSCDVYAYQYTYSFEPNPEWSHRFARGPEIQAYLERIYAKYGLEKYVSFNTEVASAVNERDGWTVTTKAGAVSHADFLVSAAGVLHHPRYPDIPGLDSFAGKTWHSARWDHSVDLSGKRVGLIGTGSTAIQIVCGLSGKTRHLTQFQRTAQWVHPAWDTPYSEWSKKLLRRWPALAGLLHHLYAFFLTITFNRIPVPDSYVHAWIGWNCRRALNEVKDPEQRRKLTPNYTPGCKRLIISDEYYTAVQRPDYELVTEAIECIEPKGVRTRDGRLHEFDVLVTATGFYAHHYMRPMQVIGENGLKLDDFWKPGAIAYRAVAIPGFPNFFTIVGPHSPIGNFSLIAISEAQIAYFMQFIEMFRQGKARRFQPDAKATQRYNEALRAGVKNTVWSQGGCQSWYLDQNGLPALWPWTFARYKQELQQAPLTEFQIQ